MSESVVRLPGGVVLRLLGHWLYVRKCLRPDVMDEATGKVLIELPEWARDFAEQRHAWVELLAKGPEVGRPAFGLYGEIRTKRGYARHIPDALHIGDLLLIPAEPWRFHHSPYAPKGIEFFIDETVPIAACPQEVSCPQK